MNYKLFLSFIHLNDNYLLYKIDLLLRQKAKNNSFAVSNPPKCIANLRVFRSNHYPPLVGGRGGSDWNGTYVHNQCISR